MTATTLPIRPADPDTKRPAAAVKRRGQWLRRWYKLLTPLLIVFVLIVWTFVAHILQGVDVTDASYLSPTSSAPHGSADLAGRLRANGITVRRVTSTAAAFGAITSPTTVFIPAPALVEPIDLSIIRALPTGTRVVLVAPEERTIEAGNLPFDESGSRWATQIVAPDCALPEALKAGAAAVDHIEYVPLDDAPTFCYDDSLLDVQFGGVDLVVVGATDPFRNDRITEHGNAALAVGLLSTRPAVVWLDLHRAESITPTPIATVSQGDLPGGGDDGNGGGDSSPQSSITDLFPGWLWTALGVALLVGLVLALAASRRLGPPVTEPMAVAPRANETVEGRGRLYRRTRDKNAAFGMLRAAVVARLSAATNLPPDASETTIVDTMAARTGRPTAEIQAILYGADLKDAQELVDAVARLDALAHTAGL